MFFKRLLLTCFCLVLGFTATGCTLARYEDYYAASIEAQQKETSLVEELRSLACEPVPLNNSILLTQYGDEALSLVNGVKKPLHIRILNTHICEKLSEYNQLPDANPEFIDRLKSRPNTFAYDSGNDIFLCPITGVDTKIYMVSMELYNPSEQDIIVHPSSFKLYERNPSDNTVRRLNILEQYCYDTDTGDILLTPGETVRTTLISVQPTRRIVTYYWTADYMRINETETIHPEEVYLRLSMTGSRKVLADEYFFKIPS